MERALTLKAFADTMQGTDSNGLSDNHLSIHGDAESSRRFDKSANYINDVKKLV